MPLSVLDCFIAFLTMPDDILKKCIDFYNSGEMAEPAKLALEALEYYWDHFNYTTERR
jgi:hypothetical protein